MVHGGGGVEDNSPVTGKVSNLPTKNRKSLSLERRSPTLLHSAGLCIPISLPLHHQNVCKNWQILRKNFGGTVVAEVEVGVAEINSQLCSAMFSIVLSEAHYSTLPVA